MEKESAYPRTVEGLADAFEDLDQNLSPIIRRIIDTLNNVTGELAVHTSLLELVFDHADPKLKDAAADIATLTRLEGDLQVEDREN